LTWTSMRVPFVSTSAIPPDSPQRESLERQPSVLMVATQGHSHN
jgi:hypothetical protein